jgi:hypothetical protein
MYFLSFVWHKTLLALAPPSRPPPSTPVLTTCAHFNPATGPLTPLGDWCSTPSEEEEEDDDRSYLKHLFAMEVRRWGPNADEQQVRSAARGRGAHRPHQSRSAAASSTCGRNSCERVVLVVNGWPGWPSGRHAWRRASQRRPRQRSGVCALAQQHIRAVRRAAGASGAPFHLHS